MANTIVAALEQAAERIGKTLSKNAAQAIEDMYRDVGKGTEQVIKNLKAVDDEHAGKLLYLVERLGQESSKEAGSSSEHSVLHDKISSILDPTGEAATEKKTWDSINEDKLFARPKWRKRSVTSSWEDAQRGPNSGRLCPTCGTEVNVAPFTSKPRDWDIDHQPPWADRVDEMRAQPVPPSRSTVIDRFNADKLRLECSHCNRSRGRAAP